MSDERWQQEMEQERLAMELEALKRVAEYSEEDAQFFAAELGIANEWRQVCKA